MADRAIPRADSEEAVSSPRSRVAAQSKAVLHAVLVRAQRWSRPVLFVAGVLVLGVTTLFTLADQQLPQTPWPAFAADSPALLGNGSSLARLMAPKDYKAHAAALRPAATAPAPAPPSLANAAPLASHEVFGFAPYWTLDESSGFDVSRLTTLAYFSVDVNPDGSLDRSGAGWNGYESQDLADLITRAHAAGDRVVLTVDQFDQGALDQLTSSPTAPQTLSSELISAVEAKNLDGVNLDFEGEGSADQAGLTNLVSKVSTALHLVNPHWQVTMDTYASSAGDPAGFYDIPALSPWVDGFFVMEYSLNLASAPSISSPLTSGMFSDVQTAEEYTEAVPPSKVILGVPYYGYDWPTTDGTLSAHATGDPTTVTYGQVAASGHQMYWDPTTKTGWTSYQVGDQWHEAFVENPSSLYMEAQLAAYYHLDGLGIWALGMDDNDPAMLAALSGFAPVTKDSDLGPVVTSPSPSASPPTTSTTTPTPPSTTTTTTTTPGSTTTTTTPGSTTTTTTTTAPTTTTTTTTTVPTPPTYTYSATFGGQAVVLAVPADPTTYPVADKGPAVGEITDFATDDPALVCLAHETSLSVYAFASDPNDLVVIAQTPTDCADGVLTLALDQLKPSSGAPSGSTSAGS